MNILNRLSSKLIQLTQEVCILYKYQVSEVLSDGTCVLTLHLDTLNTDLLFPLYEKWSKLSDLFGVDLEISNPETIDYIQVEDLPITKRFLRVYLRNKTTETISTDKNFDLIVLSGSSDLN